MKKSRGLDPTGKWSRGELTVIRTSQRIAHGFRNGLLSQNPVGISESEWKKKTWCLVSQLSALKQWILPSENSPLLYQSYTQSKPKNSEENNSWNAGQHEVGRRIGHIIGIALGIVRLGLTSCYQHWGLPAGNSCFPLHIFLPSTWVRCSQLPVLPGRARWDCFLHSQTRSSTFELVAKKKVKQTDKILSQW